MRTNSVLIGTMLLLLVMAGAKAEHVLNARDFGKIVPGRSTKADVHSILGTPWRIVQFNDCGMAMDDQADETWEYRGVEGSDSYRFHIEFSDNGTVHLVAKIPDAVPGGKATAARAAPDAPMKGTAM